MSLRETAERNIGLFVLGTLAAGFAAGWGAYGAVQSVAGRTSISIERLQQLERTENQDKKSLQARIEELEAERAALRRQLLVNRPTTGNYIHNIHLDPASPATIKTGEDILVSFDYVLNPGERAHIWAEGEGTTPILFEGSPLVEGSGSDSRYITGKRPGKITTIIITMKTDDDVLLHQVSIPVDYTYN